MDHACVNNLWIDFKSMHDFFEEIMLSQISFLLGWAKLKLFSVLDTKKIWNEYKIYTE